MLGNESLHDPGPGLSLVSIMLVTNCQALIHNEVVMKDFRQLKVWEKAHLLALAVYPITARFPREETYGLTAQIRRAACSIPSNIAEGCG